MSTHLRFYLVLAALCLIWSSARAAENGPTDAGPPVANVMFAHDAQHSGYVRSPGPLQEPKVIWEARTRFEKAVFDMAPTIDSEGNLYSDIGSSWRAAENGRTGGAISFDRNGKERWRSIFPKVQYGLSVPALTGAGTMVMGFRDGAIRSFDCPSGRVEWDFNVGGAAIIAAPAVDAKGNVYLSTLGKGGVYKLDGNTGDVLWNRRFDSGSGASPALSHDEKTVYVGWAERDPGLYAIDAESGATKWKWAPEGEFFFDWCSPMVGHDGTVYQQNEKNGTLFAVDDRGTSGVLKWSYVPGGEINDAPRAAATDGKDVYFGASGKDPQFTALTLNGRVKWKHIFPGKVEMANIVVNDDAVYFPIVVPDGGAGWVYALDKANGRQLWRKKLTHDDSDVGGVTLGEGGVLYAGTSGTEQYPYEGVLVAMK